ncbi:MAG: T9SS type A sorting domain-containing protein [Bacteroidales bacterium]|jgi:hypothetical protein|nr:T9SS type A sorting domain-containing protein [Bacteroidales bacterium]
MSKIFLFFSLTFLLFPYCANSQCPNLNLSMANFTYWQCYTGSCANGVDSVYKTAPVAGKHTMYGNPYGFLLPDEQCSSIRKVPGGFIYSVKIGNSTASSEINGIEYTLTVDSFNTSLIIHFAFVLGYDTNCSPEEQARFSVIIRDTNDVPLQNLPGGQLHVVASPELDNLDCQDSNMIAKKWTTIGYGLDHLIGQTIKIYLEVRDGSTGNRFGYAYVVAECSQKYKEVSICNGTVRDNLRLHTPEGFMYHKWTRSSDTAWTIEGAGVQNNRIIIGDACDGEIFTCELTSAWGNLYSSAMYVAVKETTMQPIFQYGILENGCVYFAKHNYRNWYDTCTRTATFVDLSTVTGGTKSSIRWKINDLNITSADSLFTCQFPNPEEDSVTYLIDLEVWTKNKCSKLSEQREEHYITIYRTPEVRIVRSKTFSAKGEEKLTAGLNDSRISSYQWSWKLDDNSTGSNNIDTLLTVSQKGIYWIDVWTKNNCHLSDTVRLPGVKTFFQYGIADENGHVDFESNHENRYDTCDRKVTFVDLSTLYDVKIKSRTWKIEGVNTVFTDSIFTFQFPDYNKPTTHTVSLTIVTRDNDVEIYEDSITIFPYPKVDILLAGSLDENGEAMLIPVSLQGNFVSYQWYWRLEMGHTGFSREDTLSITEPGIYFLTVKDDKTCLAMDTVIVEKKISVKELTSLLFSLGQNIPNPANNITVIPFSLPNDGNVEFELFSTSGQLLNKETIAALKGNNQFEYNTTHLPVGIYYYSVKYSGQRLFRKMLVKKE